MNNVNYLTFDANGSALVIGFAIPAAIDSLTVDFIAEELKSVIEESIAWKVVLDFDGVTFISSEMLGKLVAVRKHCDDQGRSLKLCNLDESLVKLLEIMDLDSAFDIQPTVENAVCGAW